MAQAPAAPEGAKSPEADTASAQAAPAAVDTASEAAPASESSETPEPAPAAVEATSAPTAASVAAPAVEPAPSVRARCLLGDYSGVRPGDAQTAAALVCEALREEGADVEVRPVLARGAQGTSAYRVDLRTLGKLVIVQVTHERPLGNPARTVSLRLANIEEVAIAAPRLARSLLRGTPIEESASVSNLVGEETREYKKKGGGETLFGLGILGFTVPQSDMWAGYGAYARFYYEVERYAMSFEARLGGSSDSNGDAYLYGLSVGGRYFFNDADVSPFVGGGLGILWIGVKDDRTQAGGLFDRTAFDGNGLTVQTEVGVEFMRMHEARVDVLLRLDIPVFDLEGDGDDLYAVPVSLMASYSFD